MQKFGSCYFILHLTDTSVAPWAHRYIRRWRHSRPRTQCLNVHICCDLFEIFATFLSFTHLKKNSVSTDYMATSGGHRDGQVTFSDVRAQSTPGWTDSWPIMTSSWRYLIPVAVINVKPTRKTSFKTTAVRWEIKLNSTNRRCESF